MFNGESIGTRQIILEEQDVCESPKELLTSRSFYLFLERFSTVISRKEPEFDDFFNRYFNHEGYKDIWSIPNLLLDIYNNKMEYHKELLEDECFRKMLAQVVGRFHNYCMEKEGYLRLKESKFNDENDYDNNLYHVKKKQLLFNLITEVYCDIMDKISVYK